MTEAGYCEKWIAYSPDRFDLASGGESHFANGVWVSGGFFRVLGVPALRGRVFTGDDDRHGGGRSGPVAVISYAFWQANFGGDSNVLGRTISLDRQTIQKARIVAARRSTSISGLVARQIEILVGEEEAYERVRAVAEEHGIVLGKGHP